MNDCHGKLTNIEIEIVKPSHKPVTWANCFIAATRCNMLRIACQFIRSRFFYPKFHVAFTMRLQQVSGSWFESNTAPATVIQYCQKFYAILFLNHWKLLSGKAKETATANAIAV